MTLFWKSEDHGYPFRKWLTAELPVKVKHGLPDGSMTKDGDVKLVLAVVEIKAAKGPGYLWTAEATFSKEQEHQLLNSVSIFVGGGQLPGDSGHLENEIQAKNAVINGAKLALLELINDLR